MIIDNTVNVLTPELHESSMSALQMLSNAQLLEEPSNSIISSVVKPFLLHHQSV